jgi:predicted Zn-dependent peptidase
LDSGSITVYAGVEPKNLSVAIEAILEQLDQLKETVSELELTKAKELFKGRLLLRMENSRNVAGWIGAQETLVGRIFSIEEVVSLVDAITADDLQQLVQELMLDNRLRVAIVGPASSYYEPLEELLKL